MKTINTFSLLKAMLDIAPKNDVRSYINGIHISRDISNEVIIEATDGHSLLRVSVFSPEIDVLCVKEDTSVILDRSSVANMLKMFTYKTPPIISASGTELNRVVHFDTKDFSQQLTIETLDGRFPDCNRVLQNRTKKNQTAHEQGVCLNLLSRVAKATSKLIDNAVFSMYDNNGFKFVNETEAGVVIAIIMPCRL